MNEDELKERKEKLRELLGLSDDPDDYGPLGFEIITNLGEYREWKRKRDEERKKRIEERKRLAQEKEYKNKSKAKPNDSLSDINGENQADNR